MEYYNPTPNNLAPEMRRVEVPAAMNQEDLLTVALPNNLDSITHDQRAQLRAQLNSRIERGYAMFDSVTVEIQGIDQQTAKLTDQYHDRTVAYDALVSQRAVLDEERQKLIARREQIKEKIALLTELDNTLAQSPIDPSKLS